MKSNRHYTRQIRTLDDKTVSYLDKKVRDKEMIDLFLLIVSIVNCILFVLILNWCKRIELFYDSTCTYLKSVRDYEKNIQEIYEHTEKVYQIIMEQHDEVAKLMGWRDENG